MKIFAKSTLLAALWAAVGPLGLDTKILAAPAPVVVLSADAITGVANGAAVSTWTNSAPGGKPSYNATVSTGDTAPTLATAALNGLPVVHFTAAQNDGLAIAEPVQNDFTIVCVFRSKQGLGDGTQFYNGAGLVQGDQPGVVNDYGMALSSTGQVCAGTGNPDVTAESPSGFNDGNAHIAVFTRVKSTGVSTVIVDDGTPATTTGGMQTLDAPQTLGIGCHTSNGLFLDGDIASIEIFDSALSDADRMAVETALKSKWGIK